MNSSGKRIAEGGEGINASKKIHTMEKEEYVIDRSRDMKWIGKFLQQNNLGRKIEAIWEPIFLERSGFPTKTGWVNKTFIVPPRKVGGISYFGSQTEYVGDGSQEETLSADERRKLYEKLIRDQEKSMAAHGIDQEKSMAAHGIVPGPGVRPVFSMAMAD